MLHWLFSSKRMPDHLRTGIWGERIAARHLRRSGMRILGKRVRIGRHDEIDLVAREKNELVFVEVKTRASEEYGRPVDAVTPAKQRALCRAAARYLARLKQKPDTFRFDVVEVVGNPKGPPPEVRHIRRAFAMDTRYQQSW